MDGLLRAAREERPPDLPPLRYQPPDVLPLAQALPPEPAPEPGAALSAAAAGAPAHLVSGAGPGRARTARAVPALGQGQAPAAPPRGRLVGLHLDGRAHHQPAQETWRARGAPPSVPGRPPASCPTSLRDSQAAGVPGEAPGRR